MAIVSLPKGFSPRQSHCIFRGIVISLIFCPSPPPPSSLPSLHKYLQRKEVREDTEREQLSHSPEAREHLLSPPSNCLFKPLVWILFVPLTSKGETFGEKDTFWLRREELWTQQRTARVEKSLSNEKRALPKAFLATKSRWEQLTFFLNIPQKLPWKQKNNKRFHILLT